MRTKGRSNMKVLFAFTTFLLLVCAMADDWGYACPAVYDPVCGEDGITYGNSCEAKRAGVCWAPGECCNCCDRCQGCS